MVAPRLFPCFGGASWIRTIENRPERWGATTDVAIHGNVLCSPLRLTIERRHVRWGATTDVANGNVLCSPLRLTIENRPERWGATTDVAIHGNVLCSPLPGRSETGTSAGGRPTRLPGSLRSRGTRAGPAGGRHAACTLASSRAWLDAPSEATSCARRTGDLNGRPPVVPLIRGCVLDPDDRK